MKKRLLSILLALGIVLALLPGTALAEDGDFTIENGVLVVYNGPGGDVVIPSSVTSIGDRAFMGRIELTNITIPNSVTDIGYAAFVGCYGLTNVTIPNSVTSIGGSAFDACYGLTSVTIPESVSVIGDWAFLSCRNLTSVTIPASVTNLGEGAFCDCAHLTSVTIPKSIVSINRFAFMDCRNLTSITIPGSVTYIGGAAFYRTGLKDVYYNGSELDWQKIRIESDSNEPLHYATIHYPNTEVSFSYSLDGGSWSLPEECYTYSTGEQIVIESEAPLKDGYYFVGWSDGSRTYQSGGTYTMPSHDVTLTAQWGIGPLNLINIARDEIIVTESYTAAPRYTLVDGATVSWTSADSSIASVDSNGVVTGVHFGKTTITGKVIAPGAMQTVSYPVTVNPNYKISFTNAVVHLAPGKSTELYCNVLPLDGKGHIKFHSDKPEIVSVSGNTITAVGEGSATITASFDPAWLNEFPCEIPPVATCKVTVSSGEKLASEFATAANSHVGHKRTEFTSEDQSELTPGNWCGDFVGLCAKKVNISDIIDYANYKNGKPADRYAASMFNGVIARGGVGVRFVDEIKTKLPYEPNRASFTPEVGDIVLIDWFGNGTTYDHIGIVYSVNKNEKTFTVIDGNAGDGIVKKRNNQSYISDTFSDGYGRILAIVRPNWAATEGAISGYRDDKYKCPIDVRYLYDGETLDSATEQFEASFGTMERTNDGGILVHLNNYYDVDVTINGTGVGTMDITSTFRDSDGTTSTRKFQGVPITEETIGKLFVYDSAATEILEIYKDNGDTFAEVWAADGSNTVSSADKDLTEWYLSGDTTDVESDNSSVPTSPDSPAEDPSANETYHFQFTDVLRTDWFYSAVEYVFTNDLMSGTAPYTFDPQGKMNRAMVWTVLGRMADADVDGSESPWYSKAQTWAMSSNMSDGTNPTNSISRQELMTMLWRYMGSPAATADLSKFSDRESVAD